MEVRRFEEGIPAITLFVLAIHSCFLLWAWLDFETAPKPKKQNKLVVKTIPLNPKKEIFQPSPKIQALEPEPLPTPIEELLIEAEPEPIPKAEPVPVPVSKPKVKKIPPPKKKSTPKPEKKVEKPKPQIAKEKPVKKTLDPKKKELLAKAQESIAKIQSASAKIGSVDLKLPQIVVGSPAEELSVGEIGYRDELASRLQLMLKMPERGQVKIKLTLNRVGKMVMLSIVSSDSKANGKYIEKTIPTLLFPGFGSQFGKQEEYTFSITLHSDL